MLITDVRVRKLSEEGKMRGIVSVTFDHVFVVHDIKIIEGQAGLFVAMPSRKVSEGEYRDIAHPISSQMREEMQSQIIAAYESARAKMREEETADLKAHEVALMQAYEAAGKSEFAPMPWEVKEESAD